MKNWLLEVKHKLMSTPINSSHDNGRRMCSALVILDLIFRLSSDGFDKYFVTNEIVILFSMLHLRPEARQCYVDLDFLCSIIPVSYHAKIADMLIYFTNKVLPEAEPGSSWVHIVPLIHLFNKKIKAFEEPKMRSADISWNDSMLRLHLLNALSFKNLSGYVL